jgi:chemotaxis protein CheD
MNHFVLPYTPQSEDSLRYGDVALERLRDRMLSLGCEPGDLRAKMFGGAAVLPFGEGGDTVGSKNVDVALQWLRHQSIPVLARRTGGQNGLLIRFHTRTGHVLVRTVGSSSAVMVDSQVPLYDSRFGLGAGG